MYNLNKEDIVHSEEIKSLIQKSREILQNGGRANSLFLLLRYNDSLAREIIEETRYLDEHYSNPEIGQRVWGLRENLDSVKFCKYCGTNPLKWHRYTNGYFKTCGENECKQREKSSSFKKTIQKEEFRTSGKREKWIEGRKKTMMKKYGVDHNWKGELREKSKKIIEERYGVDHPMKSEEIKEKRRKTCLEKFGTDNMLSLEKTKKTNLLKWGHESVMKNEEIKNRVFTGMKRSKNRKTQEKLDLYGISLNSSFGLFYDLTCHKCNFNFLMSHTGVNIRLRGKIDPCPKCNPPIYTHSSAEKEILQLIKKNYSGEIIENHKDLFRGNKRFSEVDIYLPKEKIAIEYNGLYWHGEFYKDKKYHSDKTKYLLDKGIRLYHIWEDEWIFNRDLSESYILNLLGKNQRVHARKCKIIPVNGKDYKKFCEENHFQGYSPATIILGLSYEEELVSIISLSKPRKLINSKSSSESKNWELIRLCSKKGTTVVGGFSKLFSEFLTVYSPEEIISYCDISKSPDYERSIYNILSFSLEKTTDSGYQWVVDGKRQNRLNWTKKKLIKLGKNPEWTEIEIMQKMGYYRIWDCGNYKFLWKKKASE